MSLFDKQYWVLRLLRLAKEWTFYGFVDDVIDNAIKEQIRWMDYTEELEEARKDLKS